MTTAKCPFCGKRFSVQEGSLCSCEEDAWDIWEEIKSRGEIEEEEFERMPRKRVIRNPIYHDEDFPLT